MAKIRREMTNEAVASFGRSGRAQTTGGRFLRWSTFTGYETVVAAVEYNLVGREGYTPW